MRRRNFCIKFVLYLLIILLFAANIGLIIWKLVWNDDFILLFHQVSMIKDMKKGMYKNYRVFELDVYNSFSRKYGKDHSPGSIFEEFLFWKINCKFSFIKIKIQTLRFLCLIGLFPYNITKNLQPSSFILLCSI